MSTHNQSWQRNMAMGMIHKPLVKMDHKYSRDQATPDFVSFQDLFRKVKFQSIRSVVVSIVFGLSS